MAERLLEAMLMVSDGEVGMPDVMFVTNYILGSPATSFSIEGADANLDGEVDNNDVKNIVD